MTDTPTVSAQYYTAGTNGWRLQQFKILVKQCIDSLVFAHSCCRSLMVAALLLPHHHESTISQKDNQLKTSLSCDGSVGLVVLPRVADSGAILATSWPSKAGDTLRRVQSSIISRNWLNYSLIRQRAVPSLQHLQASTSLLSHSHTLSHTGTLREKERETQSFTQAAAAAAASL